MLAVQPLHRQKYLGSCIQNNRNRPCIVEIIKNTQTAAGCPVGKEKVKMAGDGCGVYSEECKG